MSYSDLTDVSSTIGQGLANGSRILSNPAILGMPIIGGMASQALGKLDQVASRIEGYTRIGQGIINGTSTIRQMDLSSIFRELSGALNGNKPNPRQPSKVKLLEPVRSMDWFARIEGEKLMPWYYIIGVTTPSLSFDTKPIFRNGKMNHYSSSFSADDATIVLHTDRSQLAFDYAAAWIRAVMTKEGYYSLPSSYKRTVDVFIVDYKRKSLVTLKLEGCWPKSWQSYTLNSNSDILTTELTLSVDQVLINVIKDIGGSSSGSSTGLLGGLADAAKSAASDFVTKAVISSLF